jgi:predicted ATP-binding protein involved in virulence
MILDTNQMGDEMRLKTLLMNNIGPFLEAEIDATDSKGEIAPVVLITGENGSGKSIILDAIRGMFGREFSELERDIRRRDAIEEARIEMTLEIEGEENKFTGVKFASSTRTHYIVPQPRNLSRKPAEVVRSENAPNWIVDYWPSALATGTYEVNSLTAPKHEGFLRKALQGQQNKQNITQLICHFDYLRDSQDPQERITGNQLYTTLERIIASSLLNGGYLSHVARSTYDPIVVQNGQSVPLANLSGGNAYLIQNMVNLLGKMHAVHYLNATPPDTLNDPPGLLLIDEAENQLHPKWQKRLIQTILEKFPNLQIVATTHSPFVIASAPEDARLFVCKAHSDHCTVKDETATYRNKPVDEILMSPLFEATRPFNAEITQLLDEREQAIQEGDSQKRSEIEEKLKRINPTYFSYLDIDEMLDNLRGKE